nr:4-(cytidine 5'-diphospho)-2-C-methyl-D-erythritol kinase [Snodgrassella sp. CFCC 13594]
MTVPASSNIPATAHAYLAPAKLNLDLRIVGRRPDGYHLLESVFTLIALYDRLWLQPNPEGQIRLHTPTAGVLPEHDLCCRAAHSLQAAVHSKQGVDIWLEKHIPMGGGLGGGSSDAALMLMALNQLWQCGLNRQQLINLGVHLGADVPFFVFGEPAFARGIGEVLTPITVPLQWYVIIKPAVHVSTAVVFDHGGLTRDSEASIMPVFQTPQSCRNDMQAVVLFEYPEVKSAFDVLARYGEPMMTGSGACVFLRFANETAARKVYQDIFPTHQAYCVAGLNRHPFYA